MPTLTDAGTRQAPAQTKPRRTRAAARFRNSPRPDMNQEFGRLAKQLADFAATLGVVSNHSVWTYGQRRRHQK
jgi:hypothetical protein